MDDFVKNTQKETFIKEIRKYGNMIKLNKNDIQSYYNYGKNVLMLFINITETAENQENEDETIKEERVKKADEECIKLFESSFEVMSYALTITKDDDEILFINATILSLWGFLIKDTEKVKKSILYYKNVIKITPDSSRNYFNLALSYYRLLNLNPNKKEGYEALTELIKNNKNFLKLKFSDEKYVKTVGFIFGFLSEYAKKPEEQNEVIKNIILCYKTAIKLFPYKAELYYEFGKTLSILNYSLSSEKTEYLINLIIKNYNKAISLNIKDTSVFFHLAIAIDDKYKRKEKSVKKLSELEKEISFFKISIMFNKIMAENNFEFYGELLYEYTILMNPLKVIIVLTEFVNYIFEMPLPIKIKSSVFYETGKIFYRLAKEQANIHDKEILIENAIKCFKKTIDCKIKYNNINISKLIKEAKTELEKAKKIKLI